MVVRLVHVHVNPEHVEAFIAASRTSCEQSGREPGNRRFDLLQSADDPTRFVLYEAYDSAASQAAHKSTAHYSAWVEAVTPMMAEPRSALAYAGLYPA